MTVTDFEDYDLDFVALSYVWAGTKTDTLFLANTLFVQDLQVTRSILNGRIDGPTMIWIDALSINQADTAERSSQVAMMYKIYSAARYVVAISTTRLMMATGYQTFYEPLSTLILKSPRRV